MIPGSFAKELPMLLFGVLAILAGLATLVLPKSEGGGLPDTLEDMKKKSRYLHLRIQRGGHWVRTPLKNDKNIGFL